MDDHLFVNVRTVCSRYVTVGEMKISYFLHSPPPHQAVAHLTIRQSLTMCWLSSEPQRTKTSWESGGLLEQRRARMCDVISGTFLCLWQMTVFSPLSWPQHLLLQIHPPPLLCLGRMSWQLSHSRCFTDEELHPPPPTRPPLPVPSSSFSLFLPLSC